MARTLIRALHKCANLVDVGTKAANLHRLNRLGMRVPVTYVLSWEAYRRYLENDLSLIEQLQAELKKRLAPARRYAVRSSANIEDCFEHSFAGQFKSVLNVSGEDEILQAIWSIWATVQAPEVSTYLAKHTSCEALRMAVILQEMVNPVISGVAFSRNPMSGAREIVIEGVRGLGTLLMQEGVTPQRWIARGGMLTCQTGDHSIPDDLAREVAEGVRYIAKKTGQDLDLEWVYDGKNFFWVQMREITSLKRVNVYSNRMSREMIPGALKPLVWTVNTPLMVGDKIRVLTELTGPNQIKPEDLVHPFYYHTYFNMTRLTEELQKVGFSAESIEMLYGVDPESQTPGEKGQAGPRSGMPPFKPRPGILRLLPRFLGFLWDKWNILPRLERLLPKMETDLRGYPLDVERLSPAGILEAIERLYALNQEIAYCNVIIQLSNFTYSGMLRNHLEKLSVDFYNLDLKLDMPEFQRFNPNVQLEQLHRLFQALAPEVQERVRRSTFNEVVESEDLGDFSAAAARLIADFGHLSDSGNDFSMPSWRENADVILRLAIDYAPRGGETRKTVRKIAIEELKLSWYARWFLKILYQRARRFLLFREQISYIYTLGYGLFRVYFLALGQYFTQLGWLRAAEDIFYLEYHEVRQLAGGQMEGSESGRITEQVAQRKSEIERVCDVTLPTIIYGEEPPPVQVVHGQRLRGTPTSKGYCTAPVRLVNGLQDFAKVQHGDILVIPFSEVAWTPLFARASGVIAEAGGMLSHSSIVAREYGIPAIVSVPCATQLVDGTLVSMDGYKGEIFVHENEKIESSARNKKEAKPIPGQESMQVRQSNQNF